MLLWNVLVVVAPPAIQIPLAIDRFDDPKGIKCDILFFEIVCADPPDAL
jgi:hypothetical protein